MINSILKKKKESEWKRVLFYIPRLKKKINRKFDSNILYGKLEPDDIDIILVLLEKETSKFHCKRLFTKVKIFYLLVTIILSTLCLIYIFYYKKLIIGIIIFVVLLLFDFQYFFYVINYFRKKYIKVHKKIHPLVDTINRKLLCSKGLHLMISPDFTYINIYLVPDFIQATIYLQNFIYNHSYDEESKKNNFQKDFTFNKTSDILNAYVQTKQGFGLI